MNEEQELAVLSSVDEQAEELQEELGDKVNVEVIEDMFEVPLVNARFDVVEFEAPTGEAGKAILIETSIGMIIGQGMMTPPKPVRFVIPLLNEAVENLLSQLSDSGIKIASADELTKLPPAPHLAERR